MTRVEVAVGVLFNANGDVLIGQRIVKDDYYQKWEFPGGKLEQGESPKAALAREFSEEIGVQITQSEDLMLLEHNYPDRHVRLYVQVIKQFSGEVTAMEGQALQWVQLDQLNEIDFLKGNQAIVEKLLG